MASTNDIGVASRWCLCCGEASGLGMVRQYHDALLPSPRAAAGRGRGWGVCQRAPLATSMPRHPPPPTPPRHARCAWEEGRRIYTDAVVTPPSTTMVWPVMKLEA